MLNGVHACGSGKVAFTIARWHVEVKWLWAIPLRFRFNAGLYETPSSLIALICENTKKYEWGMVQGWVLKRVPAHVRHSIRMPRITVAKIVMKAIQSKSSPDHRAGEQKGPAWCQDCPSIGGTIPHQQTSTIDVDAASEEVKARERATRDLRFSASN